MTYWSIFNLSKSLNGVVGLTISNVFILVASGNPLLKSNTDKSYWSFKVSPISFTVKLTGCPFPIK